MFITVTGDRDVLRREHFELMRDGAIVANAGHFDVEISKPDLNELTAERHEVRPLVAQHVLHDGRRIHLLADGRVVNLAAGEGHPGAVMDVDFAGEALCLEHLVKNGAELAAGVHTVPEEIDREVARLKLESLGVDIDSLTDAQRKYLHSWEQGTYVARRGPPPHPEGRGGPRRSPHEVPGERGSAHGRQHAATAAPRCTPTSGAERSPRRCFDSPSSGPSSIGRPMTRLRRRLEESIFSTHERAGARARRRSTSARASRTSTLRRSWSRRRARRCAKGSTSTRRASGCPAQRRGGRPSRPRTTTASTCDPDSEVTVTAGAHGGDLVRGPSRCSRPATRP